MNDLSIIIFAIISIALVTYMLVKKMDIKITLLSVGMLLMYIAIFSGESIAIRDFQSSGSKLLDPILSIVYQFKSTLGRAGLIILILGGYTSYMNTIGANKVTVNTLTKPLKKVKSVYILVPIVFLLGNLLSLVIPSASALSVILLATLYPVLKEAKMSTLTAAAVIATTATVMPTPLGGDHVAIAAELAANYPPLAGITPTEYVFGYHAIISIPTLIFMALVHYFWQKRCDKKDMVRGIVDDEIMVEGIEKVEGSLIYKIVYSILPILPIFLLLLTYFFKLDITISVETATLLSFFIAVICELIRHRKFQEVLDKTGSFFTGMGNSFGVVALLVCASIFVVGLKSTGLIELLQNSMSDMGDSNLGFVLPLILVLFTSFIVILSGSGTALFFSMVPLMVPLALAAGISPLSITVTMGMAGNLLRAVSPVAAVIIIVAGTTKKSPFEIVKRTSVPMISGVVFMFIFSMIKFL